jgi:acyl-CoA dehydrogenase
VGSPDQYEDLRRGVREVCADVPDGYWRELDARREYPEAFIEAMTTVLLPKYKHR